MLPERRLGDLKARGRRWEREKEKVLARLAIEGLPGDEGFLTDLLAAIPESDDSLSYCAQVVTASLVSLRSQVADKVGRLSILKEIAAFSDTVPLSLEIPLRVRRAPDASPRRAPEAVALNEIRRVMTGSVEFVKKALAA